MKETSSEKFITYLSYFLVTFFGILILYPMLNILAMSFSSESAIVAGKVSLFPVDFTAQAYSYSLKSEAFWRGFLLQTILALVGTLWDLLICTLMAYPLTRKRLAGRQFWTIFIVIPMYFNPGIIPDYLVIRSLGLVDTLWAMILPFRGLIYILIMKSYMESIDDSIEEAAKIDGASNIRTLISIYVPLCKPVMATLFMFFAVIFWTDYLHSSIYFSKPELKTLQLYLQGLLNEIESHSLAMGAANEQELLLAMSPQSVRAATIILVALPIVVLYPFLQKYFTQGMTIGSVKG